MNNNISFGAGFIKSVPIKKYVPENKLYTEVKANLVELSPFDKNDINALGDITKEFNNDSYAGNIHVDAKLAYNRNKPETEDMRIFALTNQDDTFERLDSKKVLGVAEISDYKKRTAEIEYLQVHPNLVYSLGPRQYKHVGSAILEYLKDYYKSIILHSSESAKMFYVKNNFKAIDPLGKVFTWEKNSSKSNKLT